MEEKRTVKAKPHSITIEGRERLIITGVRDVVSFNDNEAALDTEAGGLNVRGKNLHINKLNVEDGNLLVEGYIFSCIYNDKIDVKRTGSLFGNIFK